jgi:hypothetical protein
MDYIFDEDIFEVGAEVDAYCTRCKIDTPHTVLTKYEDEIRSVQCTTCSATHAYRPPRGDVEEEIPEPMAARRRQAMQKRPWEEAIVELSERQATPYSPKERYTEGQVVEHPRFGVGYVSELLSDTKMEAIFADGRRILVHNRGDLNIVIAPPRKGARPVVEALRKQRPALAEALSKQKAAASDGKSQAAKGKDSNDSGGKKEPAPAPASPSAESARATPARDAKPDARPTRAGKPGAQAKKKPAPPARKPVAGAQKAARPSPEQPPKPARRPEEPAARPAAKKPAAKPAARPATKEPAAQPAAKKPAGKARSKPASKASPGAAATRGRQGGKAAGKRAGTRRASRGARPGPTRSRGARARPAR